MNLRRLAAFAAFVALPPAASAAQDWPARPIRAIIPFGAGSATDLVPRIVFDQLSPQLGQPIVVENRTGAGGTLGTNVVAKAEPDGYTLFAHSNALSVSPAIYANLPYDTEKDFAPVAPFGSLPAVPRVRRGTARGWLRSPRRRRLRHASQRREAQARRPTQN